MDLTGLGSIATFAKSLVDRWLPPNASAEEKLRAETEIRQAVEARETALVEAKAKVMVAELSQDDNYTKRGRPTLIYAGLAFIGLIHVIFPMLAWVWQMAKGVEIVMPQLNLPSEFWMAWGGCVSLYVLGRSGEKSNGDAVGLIGKFYSMIGGKK